MRLKPVGPGGSVSGSIPSVADRIKEYILLNRLSPGDALPTEAELSEQLGVSRSRVREAVKALSALDIVQVRHGYGMYVGRLSMTALVESLAFRGLLSARDDQHVLADLIDVRQLIESSLAQVIIDRLTPQAALTMGRLTRLMKEKAARGEEFLAEDREFHLLLMQTTGNDLAVQLTGAFWDVHSIATRALEPVGDLTATADAHVKIVEAIEQGDTAQLRNTIEEHYRPIRDRMAHPGTAGQAGVGHAMTGSNGVPPPGSGDAT